MEKKERFKTEKEGNGKKKIKQMERYELEFKE